MTKRQLLPAITPTISRARRKNASEPEKAMWAALRRGLPQAGFRREVPLGPYHADFCSHAAKLIVEIDGATHADSRAHDEARTRFLNVEGYRVLRFWNNDVMTNAAGVIAAIEAALPSPLVGEGGAKRRMRGSRQG
ncbi:MAG TPA: endonuclease domain-containing protein [Sphingomonas sp.]